HSSCITRAEARIGLFRCVTDNDDGKPSVIRITAYGVEERLTHIVGRTIEHESVHLLLQDELVDGVSKAGRKDCVSAVTQRKRQKLGDLRRVVNEQDAWQPYATSCWRRRQATACFCQHLAPGPKSTLARQPCSRRDVRFRSLHPRLPAYASRKCIPRSSYARGQTPRSYASCQ